MTATDYALVAGWWLGYATLAAVLTWGLLRASRNAAPWGRRALVSFVLAGFFAPSVIGGGHGGGVGPAWMALFQTFPVRLGVLPIVVTFLVFFAIATAIAWARGAKTSD